MVAGNPKAAGLAMAAEAAYEAEAIEAEAIEAEADNIFKEMIFF